MGISSSLSTAKSDFQHFGLSKALYCGSLRVARRAAGVVTLQCVFLPSVTAESLKTKPQYTCRFLTSEELARYAQDPSLELDREFLKLAASKGDRCFAILDGETLASYGWYSTKPTIVDDELSLRFSPEYVYMYKGFTHPSYRGQRLHAVGMGMALNAYLAEGSKGIVSYVEALNLASLKSCYRLGYQDFGKVYVFHGQKKVFHSQGCERYGFEVFFSDKNAPNETARAAHA
jgi:hypothetical protein